MKIYHDFFTKHKIKNEGIISIGFFDSMHLGHKKILQELLLISKKYNLKNYVLTYNSLPFKEENGKKVLETKNKISMIKKLGINNLILCEFNEKFYKLQPDEFHKDH